MDFILFVSSDLGLLQETKHFLSQKFEMKDLGKTTYVIVIEIERDRHTRMLGLSLKAYIERVLKTFIMQSCSPTMVPIMKEDKFILNQYLHNSLENEKMKSILYAFAIGSLMYAQVYI